MNTLLFTQSLNCGENTKTEASLDIVNNIDIECNECELLLLLR